MNIKKFFSGAIRRSRGPIKAARFWFKTAVGAFAAIGGLFAFNGILASFTLWALPPSEVYVLLGRLALTLSVAFATIGTFIHYLDGEFDD